MDLSQLYETRMLIFIETGPQTNKYKQVLVTGEQFKIVSDAISTISSTEQDLKEGMEARDVDLSDETYELPDLNSIKLK